MYPEKNIIIDKMNIVKELFRHGLKSAINYYPVCYGDYTGYHLGMAKWIEKNQDLLNILKIEIYLGETKMCIISYTDSDWVIKIGFNRSTNPHYINENIMDYCKLEADNYSKACMKEVQNYFAATYDIGCIDDVHIYLQEYAEVNEDLTSSNFIEYTSHTLAMDDYNDEDDYWDSVYSEADVLEDSERVEAMLGVDCADIIDFIHDNHINDLHSGNWGTLKDGRVVIIDYSGYMG